MKNFVEIGERLKKLRGSKSQRKFAEEIEINLRVYQRYEKGERRPRAEEIARIAELCAITADWILGRDEGANINGVDDTVDGSKMYLAPYKGPDRRRDPELRTLIEKAVTVLQSDYNLLKEALERNILAFHQALEDHREKTD